MASTTAPFSSVSAFKASLMAVLQHRWEPRAAGLRHAPDQLRPAHGLTVKFQELCGCRTIAGPESATVGVVYSRNR